MKGRKKAKNNRHVTAEQQAENRRKLLEKLKPEVADMTRREFARLGLYQ